MTKNNNNFFMVILFPLLGLCSFLLVSKVHGACSSDPCLSYNNGTLVLFATHKGMSYSEATFRCKNAYNKKVFVPKTKEENDILFDFQSKYIVLEKEGEARFWYPKMFIKDTKKYLWADDRKEHPEYYQITLPTSCRELRIKQDGDCMLYQVNPTKPYVCSKCSPSSGKIICQESP